MEYLLELRENVIQAGDVRTSDYFLVRDPLSHLTVIGLYLLFVFKNVGNVRQTAAWVKPAMLLYDLVQVVMSFYIAAELVICNFHGGYSFLCQPVHPETNPYALRIANALWWAYISKILDMLDTFFIIMKNKTQQVTYLHVYHHATMVFNGWIGTKFAPGGQGIFGAVVNCSIHVVMYSYYFLSGLGPQMQKYLWWKRYLTQIQIMQFFALSTHFLYGACTECDYPWEIQAWGVFYCSTLIVLFTNFYVQTYQKRKQAQAVVSDTKTRAGLKLHTNGYVHAVSNGAIASVKQNGVVMNGTCCGKSTKVE